MGGILWMTAMFVGHGLSIKVVFERMFISVTGTTLFNIGCHGDLNNTGTQGICHFFPPENKISWAA